MSKTLNEDDVLKEIDRWIGYLDEDMITRIKIGIKKLPSAQPEQPIRCKDCKHYEQFIPCVGGTYNGCGAWLDDGNQIEVEPDGYCSYAERRLTHD